MSDFRKRLERSFAEDPEFRAEREAQAAVREVMRRVVEARMEEGLTQAELAERCGMRAANLCRLENGNDNPSVATLDRIACGLGRKLEINFT